MRLQSELPSTATEQFIHDKLIDYSGAQAQLIQFRTGLRGGQGYKYLRYGYWQQLEIPADLQGILKESVIEDDECLPLYMYDFEEIPM